MNIISVTKSSAVVVEKDKLASGSVGIPIKFVFDDDIWSELTKIVNFKNVEEEEGYNITLIGSTTTYIPAEVLRKPYEEVLIAVSGLDEKGNVVNTVYANLGYVEKGSTASDTSGAVTPTTEAQLIRAVDEIYNAYKDGKLDGYTPIKGVDYFTEEEVKEIHDDAVQKSLDAVSSKIEDELEQAKEDLETSFLSFAVEEDGYLYMTKSSKFDVNFYLSEMGELIYEC